MWFQLALFKTEAALVLSGDWRREEIIRAGPRMITKDERHVTTSGQQLEAALLLGKMADKIDAHSYMMNM